MSLLALQDIFLRHRERKSGVWKVGDDPSRTLFIDSGDIVFAQSTAAEDKLTAILVEKGKLTQAQLDYAMANLKPGLSIGKNLIEMGFITQRDLLDTARAQVERIAWGSMATLEATPSFEAKELEPTVVRLPLDTPAMLLAGLLHLRNREAVLDLLGPLNQVVVLEGRRIHELQLPQDLEKVLPMLDGSRTLLELSREAGVEPFRLGAFSLYLKMMGWARLHELPPLDRGALDRALTPEPEHLSEALPPAAPAPAPTLIAAIEASQLPTTNLDHLAHALDELPPIPEPEPTPAMPLAPFPDEVEEPRLQIHEGSTTPVVPPPSLQAPASMGRPGTLRWVLVTILALLALVAGWKWRSGRKEPPSTPGPVAQQPAPPTPKPEPAPEKPQPAPEQAPAEPAKLEPAPAPPAPQEHSKPPEVKENQPKVKSPKVEGFNLKDRLASIRSGDMALAERQGAQHLKALKAGRWTLRLEVACLPATVQRAAEMLGGEPDLWVRPMRMRDGKTCHQVMLGEFPSEAAAAKAAKKLPAAFHAPGNKPKPFRLDQIPDKQ
ncbi:MAG TPA: DUF4388 domain-containing protein [Holophagaceae bacterium]|nr:DUF4388 domain-containing protein [Holophagaceae bacterium]